MSDSRCCGTPKPKKANRQCHFDHNMPQQYPGIGRRSKGKLAIQLKFGYNIAIS